MCPSIFNKKKEEQSPNSEEEPAEVNVPPPTSASLPQQTSASAVTRPEPNLAAELELLERKVENAAQMENKFKEEAMVAYESQNEQLARMKLSMAKDYKNAETNYMAKIQLLEKIELTADLADTQVSTVNVANAQKIDADKVQDSIEQEQEIQEQANHIQMAMNANAANLMNMQNDVEDDLNELKANINADNVAQELPQQQLPEQVEPAQPQKRLVEEVL